MVATTEAVLPTEVPTRDVPVEISNRSLTTVAILIKDLKAAFPKVGLRIEEWHTIEPPFSLVGRQYYFV